MNHKSPRAAVFFDAVHTLFDLTPSYIGAFARVCRDFGHKVDEERMETEVRTRLRQFDRECRARTSHRCTHDSLAAYWHQFDEDVFRAMGLEDEAKALAAELERRFDSGRYAHVFPDAIEAIRAVRKLDGVATAILSNGTGGMQTCLEALGLAQEVETVLVSALLGYEKPDPEIFRLARETFGLPPERCLMVGDNVWADIEGAHAAGWKAVWLCHPRHTPVFSPSAAAAEATKAPVATEAPAAPAPPPGVKVIASLAEFPAIVKAWVDSLKG